MIIKNRWKVPYLLSYLLTNNVRLVYIGATKPNVVWTPWKVGQICTLDELVITHSFSAKEVRLLTHSNETQNIIEECIMWQIWVAQKKS